jgi:hypothetical protein
MSFADLRSDFQIVKGQFAEAGCNHRGELRLGAISQRIIAAVHAEIGVQEWTHGKDDPRRNTPSHKK